MLFELCQKILHFDSRRIHQYDDIFLLFFPKKCYFFIIIIGPRSIVIDGIQQHCWDRLTCIQSKTSLAKFGVNCHTWLMVKPAKSTSSTVPDTWVLGSRIAASITSWTPRKMSTREQFFTFHLSGDRKKKKISKFHFVSIFHQEKQ